MTPAPLERLLGINEDADLGGVAIAEGVDLGEVAFAKFGFAFQAHVHVNELDEPIADSEVARWLIPPGVSGVLLKSGPTGGANTPALS